MDSLTYFYKPGANQLDYVRDRNNGSTAHSNNYGAAIDVKDQSAGNYNYDAIGNLTYDRFSSIDSIRWNVYGKMQTIYKKTGVGSNQRRIHFYYDPSGEKVAQISLFGATGPTINDVYTWYVRDAQGNVMATYRSTGDNISTAKLSLEEHVIYGSSRLGVVNRGVDVDQPRNYITETNQANLGNVYLITFTRGKKLFEIANHLGTVNMTVTDQHFTVSVSGEIVFTPKMASAEDFTPFGMRMQGKAWNAGGEGYRYKFNGKERIFEINGSHNQYDYGMRIYDNRLGRFLSVDPLTKQYPELTPYQFASNTPIQGTDLDGLEISYHYDDPRFGVVITQAGDNLSRQIPPEHLKFIPQARNKRSQGIMNEKASMFFDNVPGVGTFKGFVEGVVGYDAAGNELSTFERASGWVPYIGKAKKTFRVLKAANKADEVNDLTKAVHKIDDVVSNEKALISPKADPTTNRVKLRKDVKETIKENQPRNDKGEMIDPNTKQPLQPDKIDIGHKPGQEWRVRKEIHRKKGSTRKEVIKEENNPDLYQLEDRSSNRSRKHEQKSNDK